MALLRQTQHVAIEQSLELSQQQQRRLRNIWNKRLKDEYAFCPEDKKRIITAEEAIQENMAFGQFASDQMSKLLVCGSLEDKVTHLVENHISAGIGFGRGYDYDWVPKAIISGLRPCCIDVSDLACSLAKESMNSQWHKVPMKKIIYPKPLVIEGEIQSLLANPSKARELGLDLSLVKIWYFCRMIGCMQTQNSQITLKLLGQTSFSEDTDPKKRNKILIINAFKDHNPEIVGTTSKIHSKKFIVDNLSKGAGRNMEIVSEKFYQYFYKKVSSIVLKAM